jgi:Phage ABA sandwich domain
MAETVMKAGPDLDALVAEKIFGCVARVRAGRAVCECENLGGYRTADHARVEYGGLLRYSREIDAAWNVVEKLDKYWTLDRISSGDRSYTFSIYGTGKDCQATAETAPLCICLAALKAVGYEEKP